MAGDYLAEAWHPITGAVYQFGNLESELDLGLERKSAIYTALMSDGGIDPYGAEGFALEPRTLGVKFLKVYGPGETFTTARDELMRAVGHGKRQKLVIVGSDGTRRVGYGKATRFPPKASRETLRSCLFEVSFTLADPILRAEVAPGVPYWDEPGAVWDDPGRFWDTNPDDFALTGFVTTHTITNPGNATERALTITLRDGITGPITVKNGANGLQFTISDSVLAGQRYVIDVGTSAVRKNGAPAYGAFSMPLAQVEWFALDPGANPITVTCGGTAGGRVRFDWLPAYY